MSKDQQREAFEKLQFDVKSSVSISRKIEVLEDFLSSPYAPENEYGSHIIEDSLSLLESANTISNSSCELSLPLDKRWIKAYFVGNIGSGKSSIISSLLPPIEISEKEKIDNVGTERLRIAWERDKGTHDKKQKKLLKEGKIKTPLPFKRRKPGMKHHDGSKILAMESILPVKEGGTTLAPTEIYYSHQITKSHISLETYTLEETLLFCSEFLDYKTNTRKNHFSREMERFIMNSFIRKIVKNLIEKQKGENELEKIISFSSLYLKGDERVGKVLKSLFYKEDGNLANRTSIYNLYILDIFLTNILVKKNSPLSKEKLYGVFSDMLSKRKDLSEVFYSDASFLKLFPSLYKRVHHEDETNRTYRFLKQFLSFVHSGGQGTKVLPSLIPKKIKFFLKRDIPSLNFIYIDTKGSERSGTDGKGGTYINSQIENISKSIDSVSVFVTRIEEAPSEDIKEIFNEPILADGLFGRSVLAVSSKTSNLDKVMAQEKVGHCRDKLPLHSVSENIHIVNAKNGMDYGILESENTGIPFNDCLLTLDNERMNKNNSKVSEIMVSVDFILKKLTLVLSEKESMALEKMLFSLRTFVSSDTKEYFRKDKYNDEVNTLGKLLNTARKTHHMSLRACFSRNGVWADLDIPSFLRVKLGSIVYELKTSTTSYYLSLFDDLLDSDLFPKDGILRSIVRSSLSGYVNDFYANVLLAENEVVSNTLSDNFWKVLQNEWNTGTGYKNRCISHIENTKKLQTIEEDIQYIVSDEFDTCTILGQFSPFSQFGKEEGTESKDDIDEEIIAPHPDLVCEHEENIIEVL